MKVALTQRNSSAGKAGGGRSTTIISPVSKFTPRNGCNKLRIKAIEGYDGYFITDTGIVLSNLKQGARKNSKPIEMHEVKPWYTKHGYARVYMRSSRTGKRKDKYIHRLVAKYFIPNPNGKKYVNHLNCDRSDNRTKNLEWCTAKENTDYTFKVNYITRDNKTGRYVGVILGQH